MTSDRVAVLRAEVQAAKDEGHPIDPDFVLRMVDLIDEADELMADYQHVVTVHESFAHDLDVTFDGADSVFTPEHRCTAQTVLGRIYRMWGAYAAERGYVRQRNR